MSKDVEWVDEKEREDCQPPTRADDTTSAVLRLECSIDCISGSVGHQQNMFRSFSHCRRFFCRTKIQKI